MSILHQQVEVLGFGSELSDSLNHYAMWKMSGEAEKARSIVQDHYLSWFKKCPYSENICFADITFFSPDQVSVRDALTILFMPERQGSNARHDRYVEMLRQYLSRKHTMAPHAVFTAGLPCLRDGSSGLQMPETKAHLGSFLHRASLEHGLESVANGFFWKDLGRCDVVSADPPEEGMAWAAKDMADGTYSKQEFSDSLAEEISQEPISEQFEEWVTIVSNHLGSFSSISGRPIRHILAIPIGFRNSKDVADYQLVACVFAAMDTAMEHHAVIEVLRYVYLHISDANATSWLLRKGELIGQDAAVVPASHELIRVIAAIRPGASAAAYNLLQSYFGQLLVEPADLAAKARRTGDENIKTFQIKQIVTDALSLAAKIEAIVTMTNQAVDSISDLSAESFDSRMQSEVSEIMSWLTSTPQLEDAIILCSEKQRHWFYLAALAALRNAVRHSYRKGNQAFNCDVSRSNGGSLIVTNAFNISGIQRDEEGKATGGTLKALRGYVRAFGKDPRRVSLRRIKSGECGDHLLRYREEWQTIIPLPGDA